VYKTAFAQGKLEAKMRLLEGETPDESPVYRITKNNMNPEWFLNEHYDQARKRAMNECSQPKNRPKTAPLMNEKSLSDIKALHRNRHLTAESRDSARALSRRNVTENALSGSKPQS